MSNMSYCRFHNTIIDLRDCYEHMDEEVSGDEKYNRKKLIELCEDIVQEFGEEEDE